MKRNYIKYIINKNFKTYKNKLKKRKINNYYLYYLIK